MTGVSFICTVFDKRAYLARVIDALARQTGPFEREFIFVDDGSSDGSAAVIEECTRGWPDPVVILRQSNHGASAATNAGVRRARLPWLKLVDGDDLLVPGATAWLIAAAAATQHSFAYGELGTYRFDDPDPLARAFTAPDFAEEADGLTRFIRNVPCNSSTILVTAERYWAVGGCDERLVSPDAALFLRLFAGGGAAHLDGPVALVPDQAPRRLSEQTRRSRYESVLALYYLVTETPGLDRRYVGLAYRRALSRARRFHRAHGGPLLSGHLLRDLAGLLRVPRAPESAIYQALAAFTEDGSTERPSTWLPGAFRRPRSDPLTAGKG
ncbi:MAG TPA: glycosyltransferase family 2 protein [Stellaceae bacterium]|nr:glycosyltransferase family 2 protein [Stellaceae bacterium]